MPAPRVVSAPAVSAGKQLGHAHHGVASIDMLDIKRPRSGSTDMSMDKVSHVSSVSSLRDLTLEEMQDLESKMEAFGIKYSRETFHDAKACPAVTLINNGCFDDLCLQDVTDLFNALDKDKSGSLEFNEIALFLKEVLDPPCTDDQVELIASLTDKNQNGCVCPDELYRALTSGPVQEHLSRLQRGNALKKRFEQDFGLNQPIERAFLVDRVGWSIGRDDAFRTLPTTLLFIFVFTFLVVVHLKVWDRQQVERGVQAWLEGYGGNLQGPFLKEHVADVPGVVAWLTDSGLPSLLGACRPGSSDSVDCFVGSRNLLLADVKLTEVRHDSSESTWLLNSQAAQVHLAAKPGDYLEAAKATLSGLRLANSVHMQHQDVEEVLLEFSTYGVESQMFTESKVSFKFDDYGTILPAVLVSAVVIRPYADAAAPAVLCMIADIIFCLMVVIPMVKELRDLVKGMRIAGAWDGFIHYWGLWNFVDWTLIVVGFAQFSTWMMCVVSMSDDSIQMLLRETGERLELSTSGMQLTISDLESARKSFTNIINWFFALHIIMCFCAIAIMLKFFKAFQANPRLRLVTDTLVKASSDIFHFSVVFLAVFAGFAVTGHIFFGNDLVQFRSFVASLDTCFIVLMGEFAWYAEAGDSDQALSSGLPFFVLLLWFWSYMVFVLLILLNMLLAIVLEHYAELVGKVKKDPDALTLFQQTKKYIATLIQTQTFIPLTDMYAKLQDDDAHCHMENVVTEESLKKSFPNMKDDQASWLMQWLKRESRKLHTLEDDETIARLKTMERCFRELAADVNLVKLNVAVCTSRLKQRSEQRSNSKFSNNSNSNNSNNHVNNNNVAADRDLLMANGVEGDLQDQVDILSQKVNTAVRDLSWQVGGAVDELVMHGATLEKAVEDASLTFQKAFRSGTSTPQKVIYPLATIPSRVSSKASRLS